MIFLYFLVVNDLIVKTQMEQNTVYFYDLPSERVRAEDIYLNNYAHSPFVIDGKEFKTVEHYYQACKFQDEAKFEEIRNAPDPDLAKKGSRKYPIEVENWEEVKDAVMYKGLLAKFDQNPDLKQKLLETGMSRLVEDSQVDPYWGGVLPNSRNKLGEFLMEIRRSLREN